MEVHPLNSKTLQQIMNQLLHKESILFHRSVKLDLRCI
jgi:hypothetical protein